LAKNLRGGQILFLSHGDERLLQRPMNPEGVGNIGHRSALSILHPVIECNASHSPLPQVRTSAPVRKDDRTSRDRADTAAFRSNHPPQSIAARPCNETCAWMGVDIMREIRNIASGEIVPNRYMGELVASCND